MARTYLSINGKLIIDENGKLVQSPDSETELNDLADENEMYATQNDEIIARVMELLINGVVDGSPRGVYDDLSALQSEFPNGASGVYLTLDNGHWWFWDNYKWTDGGVYNSSGLEGLLESKQDKFTVGEGLQLVDGELSLTYPNGDDLTYGE